MSVDNYLTAYVDDTSFVGDTKVDPLHILEVPGLMHLVQSDYARDFVEHKMHVECSRIKRLSDYLNDYEGHRKNYEGYCEMIRGEKNQFEHDALTIFGESIYGHMNTGGRR